MSMQLEIYTPVRKVFRGEVEGIQLPGLDGLFEIFSHHASLVAALAPGKMKVIDKNSTTYYNIKSGFVEMLNNQATVLVEGAVPTPSPD